MSCAGPFHNIVGIFLQALHSDKQGGRDYMIHVCAMIFMASPICLAVGPRSLFTNC